MTNPEINPIFEQAAQSWIEANYELARGLAAADHHDLRAGVSSSGIAIEVARTLGLPVHREADDADLQVHPEDFVTFAASLGNATVDLDTTVYIRTGDGLPLSMQADEARLVVGGTKVQFMRPHGPLAYGAHSYRTTMNDTAAEALTRVRTDFGFVPFSHPLDIAYLYAISQRRHNKFDLDHAGAMLQVADRGDEYALRRAMEVGLDARTWAFMIRAEHFTANALGSQVRRLRAA
jgi:hypothetical protein